MKRCALGGVYLLVLVVGLSGQGMRASLTGRVSDESGAVIPGAKITLVNLDRKSVV